MAVKIEKGGWAIIFTLGLGLVGYSLNKYGILDKLIPGAKVRESTEIGKIDLPTATTTAASNVTAASLPGSKRGCDNKDEIRFYHWAWNAQMGMMFATGGPQSSDGSLMCKEGANVRFVREDDAGKMQEALVAFATELKGGSRNPSKGAHFVAIMGDGAATFLKGLNDTLKKLGPDYTAKVVGSAGYSRGEDKFVGPPAWKQNPQASRGGLVAGYLRDGDWNIAQKWLGDNSLCNNPDEKTYDPKCLNWVAASDYIDAGEKYISGYCEERAVVDKGKKTGEKKRVCVNGVVTWTPGDVNVAKKKGGLVSIVSTKEYSAQMPNVIIGIDKWMKDNRATVEGMLKATFDGGDQVKAHPAALKHAAQVSTVVYHESNADYNYWERYYNGVTETDKQGLQVELGGSTVNNLADNLLLFGLTKGSANVFAATYQVFGDIVVKQYPDLVPSYYPVAEILDTSYIENIAAKTGTSMTPATVPSFSASDKVANVVSRRAWNITFDTGKATFTAHAKTDLDQMLKDLLVAGSTSVEIHGHTDSVGDANANMQLSEARSFAVKKWLEEQSSVNFPEGRLRVFAHGQQNPVAPNSTDDGRAKNRRVEIVIGTTK
ncbi:MAG: OmpA family protein [Acidobacteria bacterium]|nr:OmpA family protein [Acidobacteriota bacterium]